MIDVDLWLGKGPPSPVSEGDSLGHWVFTAAPRVGEIIWLPAQIGLKLKVRKVLHYPVTPNAVIGNSGTPALHVYAEEV